MPQVDYSKCVIYKIQHKEKDELLYVGSTTHFGNRKVRHKCTCYNPNGKSYNSKLYTTIRDNGGWDAFNMVIVKEFPCENKRQAQAEEDKVMRELKSNLNTIRAYQTPEERRERHYVTKKLLRQSNLEKFKEKDKEYYEKNRDKILERTKEHYQQNREKIIDYNKEYREQNKNKIKERDNAKYECPCGGKYTHGNKAIHLRTFKHQTYLNQQTEQ